MPLTGDASLQWSPSDLVTVVDHLPAMVAFWDAECRNGFANRAYLEWFGRSPEQIRGMHISDLLGQAVYSLNRPYIDGVLGGQPQLFERTLVDAAGQTRYTQASYTPHLVDGRVRGFFVLVTDITTRVLAEAALAHSHERIAVMQDRQRIAADVHDVVIQRLFALGLETRHAGRSLGPQQQGLVTSIIGGLDEAIHALRSSIVSLEHGPEPSSPMVTSQIEHIVGNASRALGFTPSITYHGRPDRIPSTERQHLLAVLTEALSNVARHAEARQVAITVAAHEREITLTVADDGLGIPAATTRRSGLANMRARAESCGGTFSTRAGRPTGTVLEWRITQPSTTVEQSCAARHTRDPELPAQRPPSACAAGGQPATR